MEWSTTFYIPFIFNYGEDGNSSMATLVNLTPDQLQLIPAEAVVTCIRALNRDITSWNLFPF